MHRYTAINGRRLRTLKNAPKLYQDGQVEAEADLLSVFWKTAGAYAHEAGVNSTAKFLPRNSPQSSGIGKCHRRLTSAIFRCLNLGAK
jgi:hypothetical protein